MKIGLGELNARLDGPVALFICMASFESRCTAILEQLKYRCNRFKVYRNAQAGKAAEDNLKKMVELVAGRVSSVELDLDDPMTTANAFLELPKDIASAGDGSIFVDVTTFTHEQLLVLFRVLSVIGEGRKLIFGYTGADRYSVNTASDQAWLSKGVSQVRSILGYPGVFRPSRRLHLIVLVGFEHERAKTVIETFEPSVLTLGLGEQAQSVSSVHYETNKIFFEDLRRFVDLRMSIGSARQFSFSCVDPVAAKAAMLNEVKRYSDHNTVICPMNTKLSTLGAALAASEQPEIQLSYSRAIEYNEAGYSTPSNEVTLFIA